MATIIDLTRMLAGPFATLVLGDLNHRIIKIEERRIGDATRHHPPYHKGVSAYFFSANRNKESVIVDLKSPEGRRIILDLIRNADAVMENFRPGVMESLGLSYADLKAVNPAIILVSITGFGSYGPLKEHISFDVVAQAMSGSMMATTPDPGEPIKPALALGDLGSALYGTIAFLTAMLRRTRTGQGTHMEVSLLDVMFALSNRIGEQQLLSERGDAPHERLFPDDVFATADGFLALSAYTDANWAALCRALERSDWVDDSMLGSPELRMTHQDRVRPELVNILRGRTTANWLALFAAARVPAAPVAKVADVVEDPELAKRNMLLSLDHPIAGPLEVLGNPIKRPGRPYRSHDQAAPRHGAHTRAVLSADLGYPEEEIDRLIAAGVVADLSPEPA